MYPYEKAQAAGLQQGDNVMVFVETEASKKPKPGPLCNLQIFLAFLA